MRKKWSAVLLAVLAVSVFAGCGARQTEEAKVSAAEALETDSEGSAAADPEETTAAAEASEQESRPRGPFEAFTAADLEGNPVSEEIFKDYDLTMINIWATFCGPCISEMPDLGKLNEEWKEKGVQVVGICTDLVDYNGSLVEDQLDVAKEIVEQTGASYLHINPEGDLARRLLPQISVVPTTVFVDREGAQVTSTVRGSKSLEEWEGIIEKLLDKQKDS